MSEINPKRKSIASLFTTDQKMELEGVEILYGDFGSFTLARAGGANTGFQREMERLLKPYRALAEKNERIPDKVARESTATALSRHCVKGWDIVDEDGNQMPFSESECKALLLRFPELLDDLLAEAQKIQNYRAAERADEAKA